MIARCFGVADCIALAASNALVFPLAFPPPMRQCLAVDRRNAFCGSELACHSTFGFFHPITSDNGQKRNSIPKWLKERHRWAPNHSLGQCLTSLSFVSGSESGIGIPSFLRR